jgi:hypothetical protein
MRPVAEVMALAERQPAPGEATAPIPVLERPPQRRGNGPRPRADLHDAPVRIVPHHHPARIARQPLRRLGRDAGAALEHRLARGPGVLKDGGVDMDDHLVPLARRPGVEAPVQRRLGQQRQRVRLLLAEGRRLHPLRRKRFRGSVKGRHAGWIHLRRGGRGRRRPRR